METGHLLQHTFRIEVNMSFLLEDRHLTSTLHINQAAQAFFFLPGQLASDVDNTVRFPPSFFLL